MNFMRQLVKTRRSERGFSLIELMIVIAIIGILIGVGIPAWKSSVIAANESGAVRTLNAINAEERSYYIRHSNYGSFDQLIDAGAPDSRFAGGAPTGHGHTL